MTRALYRLKLPYVVAIRSNHPVWLFPGEHKRYTHWRPFDRDFADGTSERRYLREIVFGRRTPVRYYPLTTDPLRQPEETTWYLKTNLSGKIQRTVGNTFGLRTWIEYGFKQAKDELGWADYRLTDAHSIERWWEVVMSAYTLVSLQSLRLRPPPAGERRRATADHRPSTLGYRRRLEAPAQQPAPAPPALRLRRALAAVAASL